MGLFSSYSQTCVSSCVVLLVFFFFDNFIYLFVFGCAGSSLLCWCFSSWGEQGLLSSCSAQASQLVASLVEDMLSGCGAWA